MEFNSKEEREYYELLVDMVEDGIINEASRNILNKRKEKYGINNSSAMELEEIAMKEIMKNDMPQFQNEEEEDYYELLTDLIEYGSISENNRNILNKRKIKYGISDLRAEELEKYVMGYKDSENTNNNDFERIREISIDLLNRIDHYDENLRDDCLRAYDAFKEINRSPKENYEDYPTEYYNFSSKLIEKFEYLEEYEFIIGITRYLQKYAYKKYVFENMGEAYINIGSYKKAKKALLKALDMAKNDHYILYLLGNANLFSDNYDDAIYYYNKAIDIYDNCVYYWNNLGVALADVGRKDDAINAYERAIEIDPDYKLAKNNLNDLNSEDSGIVSNIVKGIGKFFK